MALEIQITSGPKGSNPGGKCRFPIQDREYDGYIKYCTSSRVPKGSLLDYTHQPIYEVITIALAKFLGLHAPPVHVLCNEPRNITFKEQVPNRLNPNMRFYFLSQIIPIPVQENLELAQKFMQRESVYRDLLLVSDIVGKKQNYVFQGDGKDTRLIYLDLGCSFVRAVNGVMDMNNKTKKGYMRRDLRKDLKKLDDYVLIPNNPDALDFVPLDQIVTGIPNLDISCLNSANGRIEKRKVVDFLHSGEIEEIQEILAYGLASDLKTIKEQSDYILTR